MALPAGAPFLRPHEAVTVDNCHREPIHIPGLIQEHGAFIAVGMHAASSLTRLRHRCQSPSPLRTLLSADTNMIVRHVSENLHLFLGHKWEQVIGKHVSALIEGFTATYESVQAFEVERTAAFTHFTGTGLCSGVLRALSLFKKKGSI